MVVEGEGGGLGAGGSESGQLGLLWQHGTIYFDGYSRKAEIIIITHKQQNSNNTNNINRPKSVILA